MLADWVKGHSHKHPLMPSMQWRSVIFIYPTPLLRSSSVHIVCDTIAPLPRPARLMNARPCDVSRSRGRLSKSMLRSVNTTGAHRTLLPRRLSNFRASTRHKSRGLETPWDHKTRRSSGTKIGHSLKYESQPCQGMDMMQLIGCWYRGWHYNDVIVGAMVSQITNHTIVHSTAYSGAGQRKPQKLRLTGLCEGSSPVTGESPAQRASKHGKCFTPFGDVIMWTAQHLHYSDVIYKRHCVWHLSHSTQCLYEGLWRLTKEASRLAFPISCEGTPIISEWQKVITAVSTSMLWRHHDNIHTWQYFDEMIKAWCSIVLFQRIHLLDQYPDIASINSLAPGNLGAIFKNASFNLVLFYKALRWMPHDFINNQLFSR